MNIALVNPPGKYRYLRDYYCASIAKSNYYYPPIDFVWLSASLDRPVKIFDAVAENLSLDELLRRLKSFEPSFIFCLISGISLEEDLVFIKEIKKLPKTKLIVLGDICRAAPEALLQKYLGIDAVLTSFASTNIMDVLNSELSSTHPVPGWALRSNGDIIQEEVRYESKELKIGVPKWDIFSLINYSFPFALHQPVATVLTDYGCSFSCSFCPVGSLKFQVRELGEVIEEIDLLVRLGIRELHLRDQTFGVNKKRTSLLLEHLKVRGVSWSCFSRIDVITEELLMKMRDAGCHTIIFGIESGSYKIRKAYGKDIEEDSMDKVLQLCSRHNINTVGTFIIGLPGEGREEAFKTIQLANSLPLDYASFNIAMPRFGSGLRDSQEKTATATSDLGAEHHNERLGFMPYEEASNLVSLANRRFYFRMTYLFRKLMRIKSFKSLLNEVKIGFKLILK